MLIAPKTGAILFEPRIGAMKKLRTSIYSAEQVWLRELFILQRNKLGLSQRELAKKMNVVYSLISKIETGDRRLDILEFIQYCQALELDPNNVLQQLILIQQKQPTTILPNYL